MINKKYKKMDNKVKNSKIKDFKTIKLKNSRIMNKNRNKTKTMTNKVKTTKI